MKKIVYFLLIFAAMVIIPFNVFAEGEEEGGADADNTKTVEKVKVYFFRGETCPHCQEAEEWFDSLPDEVKATYELDDYETWNNKDNAELMNQVAEARNETAKVTGVPYIIVGDKSWVGFSEELGGEIKAEIDKLYKMDASERPDAMKLLKEAEDKKPNDVVSLIVIIIVVAGVVFGLYKARKTSN